MRLSKAFVVAGLASQLAFGQSDATTEINPNTELDGIITAVQTGDLQLALRRSRKVSEYAFAQMLGQKPKGEAIAPLKYGAGNISALIDIAEKTRTAMTSSDFTRMQIYASSLSLAISSECLAKPSTTDDSLNTAEANVSGLTPHQRFLYLPKLAKLAYQFGQYAKARIWAEELLDTAENHRKDWPQGDAVHYGNNILGRIALMAGDLGTAKSRLLAAGKTPGSPALDTFGPNMALAKDLIIAGEREAVLAYLNECRSFWKMDAGKLSDWSSAINAGKVPDFGPNLTY